MLICLFIIVGYLCTIFNSCGFHCCNNPVRCSCYIQQSNKRISLITYTSFLFGSSSGIWRASALYLLTSSHFFPLSFQCYYSLPRPYCLWVHRGGWDPSRPRGESRLCSCVMYFLNLHQSLWFMDGFNSTTVSLRSRKHTSALVLLRGKTFIQISFNMFWTYWLRPQGGELSTKSNVRRRTLHWSQLLTHVMQIKS